MKSTQNRHTLLFVFLLILPAVLFAPDAQVFAAPAVSAGSTSVSAMVGSIGAVSGRYWMSKQDALEVGVEFLDTPWAVFFGDYVMKFDGLFGRSSKFWSEVNLYFGAGAGVGFWDRTDRCGRWHCTWTAGSTGAGNGFFLRILSGLEWSPKRYPFGVFTEIAPSYLWYPSGGSKVDFSLGARYYF